MPGAQGFFLLVFVGGLCANLSVILSRNRFLSRLSLLAPPKSLYFHTLTVISIAFRHSSNWVCHGAKALPGPLAVLGACVIEWLEWVGAKDNKGENIKTRGDDMITPPPFTPLSTSPSLFLLFFFLSYPRFPCTEPVPRSSVNQKWHVTPTPQWCADKRVLE